MFLQCRRCSDLQSRVFTNNISVKYFRTFTFVAEVDKKWKENRNWKLLLFHNRSCSIKFQKQIASIFQKHNIVIKPDYTSKKFSDYFSNKSKCLSLFDAHVIYKYTCSAEASYIGETSRQIFRRITDHCRTDKNSAILEHLFNCTHCQNSDIVYDFKVL